MLCSPQDRAFSEARSKPGPKGNAQQLRQIDADRFLNPEIRQRRRRNVQPLFSKRSGSERRASIDLRNAANTFQGVVSQSSNRDAFDNVAGDLPSSAVVEPCSPGIGMADELLDVFQRNSLSQQVRDCRHAE